MRTIEIDTRARLDFYFDWSDWLPEGDSISTYEFLNVPSGLVIEDDAEVGGIVVLYISEASLNGTYLIRCRIVTVQGRKDTRSLTLVGRFR